MTSALRPISPSPRKVSMGQRITKLKFSAKLSVSSNLKTFKVVTDIFFKWFDGEESDETVDLERLRFRMDWHFLKRDYQRSVPVDNSISQQNLPPPF